MVPQKFVSAPDDKQTAPVSRRQFMQTAGMAVVATGVAPLWAKAIDRPALADEPESLVKVLHESLSDAQKKVICLDWDYTESDGTLLRTWISASWRVTPPKINSEFFTTEQRDLVRKIFAGIIQPEWHPHYYKQMDDDGGGFGHQNIGIFGQPGDGKYQFVMTGRHMTLRCDGNTVDHVAFGGPIFYGHAPEFEEKPDHPGNVFWPQAVAANGVYKMLDGKQRELALVNGKLPPEGRVRFRGRDGKFKGIPVTELSADQKEHLQGVLAKLLEPFRQSDRDEALACLKSLGGLDACSLAFYSHRDLGNDGVWDNWRLEGPAFIWNFRGSPHIHVMVNVANNPEVKFNKMNS